MSAKRVHRPDDRASEPENKIRTSGQRFNHTAPCAVKRAGFVDVIVAASAELAADLVAKVLEAVLAEVAFA